MKTISIHTETINYLLRYQLRGSNSIELESHFNPAISLLVVVCFKFRDSDRHAIDTTLIHINVLETVLPKISP